MAVQSFTLVYNANGGSGGPSSQHWSGEASYHVFTIPSSAPSSTGRTFLGWARSHSATSAEYHPGGSISVGPGTTTLYAVWKLITYTVYYNKGSNGSGTNTTDTKTYGVPLTLKGAIFTRTGHTQTGWSRTDGGSKAYNLSGSYTENAAVTLYPFWTVITYTVSYNANGGSGAPAAQTKAYGVALTLSSTVPTRTGYNFLGWSTSSTATSATYSAGGSYTANSSATLYAVWSIVTYTVSYNKGSNGTGTNSTATKTYGVALTLKGAQFTRTGYAQTGWATSDGGAQAYALSGSYTANAAVTLYPVWTATVSTVSTTNGTLGTAQTITITRHNSSFTHTLTYKYGNATGTIVTKTTSTSVSWTPATSLASQFPAANSGTCTITCETFNGNESLGTSTTTCTLTIPDSIKPSISSFTASHYAANDIVSGWATFTAGYSQADLSVSYTLNGGATLASIAFSGPGVSSSGTATSVRTSMLTTPATKTWKVRVTDSRGRWVESSVSKTVYDYAAPVISGIAVARSDSSGTTDNGGGTYLKATPSFAYSSVNGKNSIASATLKYMVQGSSTVLGSKACTNGTTYGPIGTMWAVELTKAYNVTVTVTDALGNTSTYTTTLPSASGLWYGRGNDRLGLGSVPPGPGLYCDWDATFNGTLDVTQRRAYATLPTSNKWYRAFKVPFLSGSSFKISIGASTRLYKEVSFLIATGSNFAFVNETSNTAVNDIDAVRVWNAGSNVLYVDIHAASAITSTPVMVQIEPYGVIAENEINSALGYTKIASMGLTQTDDSPSGSLLASHTFALNTITDVSSYFSLNTAAYSGLTGRVYALYNARDKTVELNVAIDSPNTIISGGSTNVLITCSDSRYAPNTGRYYPATYVINGNPDSTFFGQYLYITTSGSVYQNDTNSLKRCAFHVTYEVN